MEHDFPTITAKRVRLVPTEPVCAGARPRQRIFRPLVIRPAILFRPASAEGPWRVDVEGDLFLPACPTTEEGISEVVRLHEVLGRTCRIAAALAMPADGRASSLRWFPGIHRRRIDIYGWAIMMQPAGTTGFGVVDRHEEIDGLPALYECPLQLLDRSEFLTARGIPHRPLAVVVRPEDVEQTLLGHERSCGCGRVQRSSDGPTPCSIADLLGC
jgi:hypothetical protein